MIESDKSKLGGRCCLQSLISKRGIRITAQVIDILSLLNGFVERIYTDTTRYPYPLGHIGRSAIPNPCGKRRNLNFRRDLKD